MNANVQKWIEALRSGEYKQGKFVLKRRIGAATEAEYCCLGVACDLYLEANPGVLDVQTKEAGGSTRTIYDGETMVLPPKVQEWLNLKRPEGTYIGGTDHSSLIGLNDRGRSFEAIADIIEREPKGLLAT